MKKILSVFLVFVMLMLAAGVMLLSPAFAGYEVYSDLAYGEGEREIMDIYVPKEAYRREANGCVLFIHGGSWKGGDKREEERRCRRCEIRLFISPKVNARADRKSDKAALVRFSS